MPYDFRRGDSCIPARALRRCDVKTLGALAAVLGVFGLAQAGELRLVAGDIGAPMSLDGPSSAARFNSLAGIAVDSRGIYVADGHAIRSLSPDGHVTTIAGRMSEWGSSDGSAAAARFNHPQQLAADAAGNVYVADRDNHAIRKITPAGMVSTVAGSAVSMGARDGKGTQARFFMPSGIAVDESGRLFVADTRNYTIRKISPSGVVSTLAGRAEQSGSVDGSAAAARFTYPKSIAVDAADNLYVADYFSHTIRKISAGGKVTTFAGQAGAMGTADGTGHAARFAYPDAVAIGPGGDLYVADGHSYTIRKISATGVVTTLAGYADQSGIEDGKGSAARFNGLTALATDRRGLLYATDFAFVPGSSALSDVIPGPSATIRQIGPEGMVRTLAGQASEASSSQDGVGAEARFRSPSGIVAERSGTIYVVDSPANTIRKITAQGAVTTLAGKAGERGHVDGAGLKARFDNPTQLALDSAGSLFVTDTASAVIRKITRAGMVSTFAGNPGVKGSVDGTGAAARFNAPTGIAIDGEGNLYVTDMWANNIRKITRDAVVTTVANVTGQRGSADGAAAQAKFVVPAGIAADHVGNLYVCDYGNRTIRKITPRGFVSTIAGHANSLPKNPPRSLDGIGSKAEFSSPIAVVVDDGGNLYVADDLTIRKITPAGAVTTVAGVAGEAGIKLGNLPGRLETASALALIDAKTLVVTQRNSVLKILLDEWHR
jgi:sugar lactone lactonase YvrE